MTSASQLSRFAPEPDLHPLYPTSGHVVPLLAPDSGLSPQQRAALVAHSLTRACTFGDLSVLQFLLSDPLAQPHVDLDIRDEEGLGLISTAILGFGAESERDVEREECVRLLIAEGADVNATDNGALFLGFGETLSCRLRPPALKLAGHLCTMEHCLRLPHLSRISSRMGARH